MADIGHDVLVTVLLTFVACGAIPVLAGLLQFLLIPVHAVHNHYGRTGPYLPNVAVVVPAWNEALVLTASINRLLSLDYPPDRLRVYVVDDASTDDTPAVVAACAAASPGRVVHLRREKGGQGKAHTLNHGLREILRDDWMQALLIMDADVIYQPDSLRKMTRHLADPEVGAVTAYIREGSSDTNYLTRFIGYEYVAAQAAARRSQNVLGAVACLAGGAQLHSRENIEAIGGQIDTSSLAEDTITTFATQLQGRRVVFEPHAVVLAEEPDSIEALWKQRLRWGRGNVQVTRRYSHLWFRRSADHGLGDWTFGVFWFSIFLLPVSMIVSSVGLVGLWLLDSDLADQIFRTTVFTAVVAYLFITTLTLQIDPATGRRSWREALMFPGLVSVLVMVTALLPGVLEQRLPVALGLPPLTGTATQVWSLFTYVWLSLSMVAAYGVRRLERTRLGHPFVPLLMYLVGFGPLLCAVTFDSYVKEFRGAAMTWDKTEKIGRVLV